MVHFPSILVPYSAFLNEPSSNYLFVPLLPISFMAVPFCIITLWASFPTGRTILGFSSHLFAGNVRYREMCIDFILRPHYELLFSYPVSNFQECCIPKCSHHFWTHIPQ